MTPCATETSEIQEASLADTEIKQIAQALKTTQPHLLPKNFQSISDELSVVNNILLRGDRIVVPMSLGTKVIRLAHEDHAGITRTKKRLLKSMVAQTDGFEAFIYQYQAWQVTGNPSRPEPMTDLLLTCAGV